MAKYRQVYCHPQAWSPENAVEFARLYHADDGTVSVEIIEDVGSNS